MSNKILCVNIHLWITIAMIEKLLAYELIEFFVLLFTLLLNCEELNVIR